LADALPIHWSKNKQGVTIHEILDDVLELHEPPITVDYQANEVVLEQRTFDAATTFQAVIDYCAEQVHGAVHSSTKMAFSISGMHQSKGERSIWIIMSPNKTTLNP